MPKDPVVFRELPIQIHEARDLARHWWKVANDPSHTQATRAFAVRECAHWKRLAMRIEDAIATGEVRVHPRF